MGDPDEVTALALAVGRTVSALLENGQQPDGSVLAPNALRPDMDDLEKIM